MSETVIPDEGVDWVADRAVGIGEPVDHIALGSGTTSVALSDTSLDDTDPARISVDTDKASVSRGSSTGEIAASVSVIGGQDIEADVEITEVGLFTVDGRLVYREVRDTDGIIIASGQRITIQFNVNIDGTTTTT